jgi:hypothetical protein
VQSGSRFDQLAEDFGIHPHPSAQGIDLGHLAAE